MFGEPIPDPDAFAGAAGTYCCAGCGAALFAASQRFAAGCGFPSFYAHLGGGVRMQELTSYGRCRTQLLCAACGLHLGHLFPNRHTPTLVRYCINADRIKKVEDRGVTQLD